MATATAIGNSDHGEDIEGFMEALPFRELGAVDQEKDDECPVVCETGCCWEPEWVCCDENPDYCAQNQDYCPPPDVQEILDAVQLLLKGF